MHHRPGPPNMSAHMAHQTLAGKRKCSKWIVLIVPVGGSRVFLFHGRVPGTRPPVGCGRLTDFVLFLTTGSARFVWQTNLRDPPEACVGCLSNSEHASTVKDLSCCEMFDGPRVDLVRSSITCGRLIFNDAAHRNSSQQGSRHGRPSRLRTGVQPHLGS